jgi:phospholipid/cholesterol/gamma-HCH transport system ATP-binding protein
LIDVRGITVRFARTVLDDVSLQVPKGCLYGLVGPGASGKSVLLKTIAGLTRPALGSITLAGTTLSNLDESELMQLRQRIGMLFQNNALFDFMSVADNVAFPLRQLQLLSESELSAKVEERLARVGLPGFGVRFPAGLSGGQKKRVGVARATITDAEILLVDEPAAGLDPVSSQKLFNLLRQEQRASGATVIMVSSDLDRLLPVTDRVGMLYQGKLLFDGTTEAALCSSDPYVHQFLHAETEGPL